MMKRRRLLITGVLLLLGGAIVNVAVAWGCASRLPPQGFTAKFVSLDDVRVFIDEQVGSRYVYASQARSIDAEFQRVEWATVRRRLPPCSPFKEPRYFRDDLISMSAGADFAQIGEHAHGWPLLSLCCEFRVRFPSNTPPPPEVEIKGGVEIGQSFKRLIPYAPIWPTFAINTIFYAAILWVVFFVPGMVRRRIRRRRGRCPACAYPIGTSPVCTECGAAIQE